MLEYKVLPYGGTHGGAGYGGLTAGEESNLPLLQGPVHGHARARPDP
jgi:hypothetical protein